MNWGHKIVIAFILFGVFIISLVVVCVRQDYHLVSADYYQRELNFQDQITQAQNVQALNSKPRWDYDVVKRQLKLVFPTTISQEILGGKVEFFRPSNANHDFEQALSLNIEGKQIVNLRGRKKGLWLIRLRWQDSQKKYYMEEKIQL